MLPDCALVYICLFWLLRSIHVSSGLLMRGPRPLDRERNSSHVLIVEAYNHDLGPMRSSVRVRRGALGLGVWVVGIHTGTALGEALQPVQRRPQGWAKASGGPELATSWDPVGAGPPLV